MIITKIEHCCLLLEIGDVRIATDPGIYSTAQSELTGIHAIVITHEHADHYHVDSVRAMLERNPGATVIANASTGKQLEQAGIPHVVIDGRAATSVNGVAVEAFDCKHEEIFEEIGQVQNTGYLFDGRFFLPGDAFFKPDKPVEILALPVAGPWCRLPDAIRYALRVQAKKAFPVHDGMIKPGSDGAMRRIAGDVLKAAGTEFIPLTAGEKGEF